MRAWIRVGICLAALLATASTSCSQPDRSSVPTLRWYVFREPSGAFDQAARRCSEFSHGAFRIETAALPADADQQRTQLVRRLAAGDRDIDIIGMDVIWTAEFAAAGWILPWTGDAEREARKGRLPVTVRSASYQGRLWAAPFTSNVQLLWYRTDRVQRPPHTWDEMIGMSQALGDKGTIEVQGARYEGLTVFFTSLLASAGGSVLDDRGNLSLQEKPTRAALRIMKELATSGTADLALSTAREDETRLAFEAGKPAFMVNYTFVWPSAHENAPEVAANMGWARWPAVFPDEPSRVTVGGINLGVGAFSRRPDLAFRAAACLASEANQRLAAVKGGLLPSATALYSDPAVRKAFPFAEVILETLADAVQRPQTPLYHDVSLAISHTLHPMKDIDPDRDVEKLRRTVRRALQSQGLL
jgi:multiple sugar transport system substrate-binding protein